MNKSLNIAENKIAIVIILVSVMFTLFHVLTGTKSTGQMEIIKRNREIKKIMIEEDVSKKEAEEIYYYDHPQELKTD